MTARRAGFTLLELILAMAMVAMLTLALYSGLITAMRARNVAVVQTESLRQAKAALDLVEQELRSVPPPGGVLCGPFASTPGGTGDAAAAYLDFYTLGSDALASPTVTTQSDGVRHVLLTLSYDGATATLTRTLTRDLLGASAGTPEVEVLAKNVRSFSARYYDGISWVDAWDSAQQNNSLPVAVEVTVAVKAPTPADAEHAYRMTRVVPMSCGLTTDAAAAVLAAVQADTDPSPPGTDTETK